LTVVFLAGLAVLWMIVFIPALLRARASAPLSSADRFRRRMDLIAPPSGSGRWVVVLDHPDRRARSSLYRARKAARLQRRRRRVLVVLVLAGAGSALAALRWGGETAWYVHFAVNAILALYVAALLRASSRRKERLAKVRPIKRRSRSRENVDFYEAVAAGARRS
jgi:hypothetical protein